MPFLLFLSLSFSSVSFSFIIILMKRILDYTITNEYKNYTIREFLTEKGYPKGLRAHLFRTKDVLFRNGDTGHSSDRLKVSDKLKIILEESMPESYPAPENIPLSILYEDEDILVINKPAHMPVHPSMTHYEHTLSNAVFYYLGSKNEAGPFRCINRLKTAGTSFPPFVFFSSVTGEMLTFTSPLPCDMAALIDPEPSAHRGSSLPAVLRG